MAKQSQNKPSGCLWLILAGFFTLIGSVAITSILPISSTFTTIVAVLLASVVTSAILRVRDTKFIIRNALFLLVFFIGLKSLGNLASEALEISDRPSFTKNENVTRTTIFENNDSIVVYQSNRVWKDNFFNSYEGSLTVRETDYVRLQATPIPYPTNYEYDAYWGQLYDRMETRDASSLDLITSMFASIHASKQLNEMEFAEMVVSCIQDIPYSFVFQEGCLPAASYEEDIARILRKCPECCIGGISHGVQTPVAFMKNLKGDCDTRTVMIYTVLKHFNYDVAILNSDFYRHSILGLNIPAGGTHKRHNGKKYMLWETTAKYYKAGSLPASFNDVTHWNVVLTSK